jgi:hypothetical protein
LQAEILNADASIFQHTALPIDITDRGFGCGYTGEPWHEIMWHNGAPSHE